LKGERKGEGMFTARVWEEGTGGSELMPYKIEHDRTNCIACAACSIVAPEFWEMSSEDGKSDLIGSKCISGNEEIVKEELEIKENDYKKNKQAAEMCPVNVIHIIRKDGTKII